MAGRSVTVTPTITAGAYSQNDCVGGVIDINLPAECTVMSVTIQDDADQGSSFELWIFDGVPAGVADNAAFSLTDADLGKVVGVLALDTWFDAINGQVCVVDNIGLFIQSHGGNYSLMLKVTDAATPTFAAVDDLHLIIGVVF